MSGKKYIAYGEWVKSENDGDWHYISAKRVAELYGVPLNETILVGANNIGILPTEDLIVLTPRFDGDYTLPKN